MGLASCGEVGARLGAKIGLSVSPTTVLRQVMSLPPPPVGKIGVLGVDDWAWRRGSSYGTILVDLEAHRVVDLLPERTAVLAGAWLRNHPEIRLISRDRGGEYAIAARRGAPQAQQVADRFHLLRNLGDSLEHLLVRKHSLLRQAARAVALAEEARADQPTACSEPGPPKRAERERLERRAWRQDRYEEVRACAQQGMTFREIARTLGVARATVSRFVQADSFPEQPPRPRPNQITRYEPYLRERWNAGEQNTAALWRELREQGYPGAASALRAYLGRWRVGPPKTGRRPGTTQQHPALRTVHLDTLHKTRWLLVQPVEDQDATERAYVTTLLTLSPQIAQAQALTVRFLKLVRERNAAGLEGWLVEAERSGLSELRAFARGIRRDREAVDNALRVEWSQGQTEGQVNRVKCLKRQMYGRAGFALLRQRTLHRA